MAESEPRAHLKEEAVSQPSLHKTPKQAQGQGVIDPQPQPMQFASSAPDNAEESESQEKKGRRKISIQFIENKSRRHITFSKRKAGIMKKVRLHAHLTRAPRLALTLCRRTSSPRSLALKCSSLSPRRLATSTPSPRPSYNP